jgi:GWxTD domain-containing protein
MRTATPSRAALGLVAAIALAGWGFPRPCRSAEPLDVSLAAASFPTSGGGAETHVYLSVPLATLTGDSALFHVRLEVEPGPASETLGGTWVYPPVPVRGTGSESGMFRHVYVYRLAPGHGRARVRVQELGSDRAGEASAGFEVPRDDDPGLVLSDLVLGTRSEGAAGLDPVLPLPQGEFGGGRDTVVAFLRIRDDRGDDPAPAYRVEMEARGRRGPRLEREVTVPRRDRSGEAIVGQSVKDLAPGEYRMTLRVTLGELTDSAEGWFRVGESGRTLGSDPDRLRTVLGYIATHREKILLEEAPDDSLSALWERFWERRDPSPETARNESEEEFLNRVEEADRRFGGLDPGWKTDMGRIYIRYGPPDRVEQFAGQLNRSPTEVWTYSTRGERFVFQDEGFGRYRLALGR